jgi:hypothetical protein
VGLGREDLLGGLLRDRSGGCFLLYVLILCKSCYSLIDNYLCNCSN